jgi:hypothetical protein
MTMSVSKMTGKLMFAMLVALGTQVLGGCVVASGTDDGAEESSEKTEQAATAPEKGSHTADTSPTTNTSTSSGTSSGGSSSGGPGDNDPEPLPWIRFPKADLARPGVPVKGEFVPK